MAHNLEIKENGEASYFGVATPAWHGLGKTVEEAVTSSEAIKLANLDYTVEKRQNFISINGEMKAVEDSFTTVRTDNNEMLGKHIGSRYQILNNINAFDFFDEIVGNKDAIFHSAAVLGKGERIFITAKMPKHISISGDDIDPYILLTNSHDGSGAVQVCPTLIRVCCANTMAMALSTAKSKISVRHTTNMKTNLNEGARILGIVNKLTIEVSEIYEAMTKVKMTDSKVKEYITEVLMPEARYKAFQDATTQGNAEMIKELATTRMENMIEQANLYYFTGLGQNTDSAKGSLFGAYNGITGYFGNSKGYKSAEDKMDSIYFGNSAKYSQKAFELAVKML